MDGKSCAPWRRGSCKPCSRTRPLCAVWFATEYLKGLAFVKKASKKSKKGAAKEGE